MQEFTGLISVQQLQARLATAGLAIVDCRFDLFNPAQGAVDFASGHLPGAVYAHLDNDLAAPITSTSGRHPLPTVTAMEATLRRLGIRADSQVVVYDAGPGALASRLWWMLRWLGHERVAVLDGGIAAWRAAGMATEKTVVIPPAGDFCARERPRWVLDTDELSRRLASNTAPLLVDAREAPRFRGEAEPIDSRAGHIPGAVNFPFAGNIGDDGRWRAAADLQQAWQALPGPVTGDEWAVMCGSGVTACHLALSAHLTGLPPPRLYAGSWSEWIRDSRRPIAT